ncbi:hypothetical protein N7512_001701 [Penicillium capsulatum]|nr:hypothetical protein N7512_001701 [Penicillium capsulatum]
MAPNSSSRACSLPSSSASYSSPSNILVFLVAFRLVNAFAVRTFFQPDEFFQSLEPAWQIAFGKGQGAWITWEWHHQLRSSLHPLLFAAIYKIADLFASALNLPVGTRAELLIAGPKIVQAVVSAIGDFYTWKLASRIYGEDTTGAWTTLLATVLNPWQWFCSTRTLSNCLETTVTIVALDLWPWQWSAGPVPDSNRQKNAGRERDEAEAQGLLWSLRQCLSLAAFACILRPTNVLIWVTLAGVAWFRSSWNQRKILVREVLICGLTVLGISTIADRLFYGIWTFPPLRFLYFNLAQSLAVFYGRNDWHYYLSQGYPLLLTTYVPFAIIGLYQTLRNRSFSAFDRVQTAMRVQLAAVCIVMPLALSLISHKEVRFIYPLLPSLHILAALPLHRTPWRSHLVYPTINAWALSCEPPINLSEAEKAVYRDEADQFYDDPSGFLRQNMAGGLRHLPRRPAYASGPRFIPGPSTSAPAQHDWPDYLVFFAQLEPTLNNLLRGSSYAECWRTFNTDWHDDWRRKGDIVVWCLDSSEQDAWRTATKRTLDQREHHFERIVEAIKKETGGNQKSGRKSLVPSLFWSSSASSFASWKRSMQSFFSFKPSSSWPWAPRSRADVLWAKFRRPAPTLTDRVLALPSQLSWPSWPTWAGGKKKRGLTDRDLWS